MRRSPTFRIVSFSTAGLSEAGAAAPCGRGTAIASLLGGRGGRESSLSVYVDLSRSPQPPSRIEAEQRGGDRAQNAVPLGGVRDQRIEKCPVLGEGLGLFKLRVGPLAAHTRMRRPSGARSRG